MGAVFVIFGIHITVDLHIMKTDIFLENYINHNNYPSVSSSLYYYSVQVKVTFTSAAL